MSQELEDKYIKCSWKTDSVVCGREFCWTTKDQKFYAEQKFTPPKFCREHRAMRKAQQQGPFGEALRQSRAEHRGTGPRVPGQEDDSALMA